MKQFKKWLVPLAAARRSGRRSRAGHSARNADPARARRRGRAPAPAPEPAGFALTKTDVDTWLDGFIPYAIESGDIAGAVVVVVKDGQVLTQRGFGYADVDKRLPVSPGDDAVPHRLGVQADHLDCGYAAGRAGQARPRHRRQHLPRFQDSRLRRQAGHPAQHHDAHGGFPGDGSPVDQRQPRRHGHPRRIREERSRADLPAGRSSGLLQLRHGAGGIHRRARLRAVVRRICRATHPHAARHELRDLPPAGPGASRRT